jgi:hypothetical protein
MEKIFSAHLKANGHEVEYHVVFENEKYIFSTDDSNARVSSFSFGREDNQWIDLDNVEPSLKNQAIDQLEKYLLSQH